MITTVGLDEPWRLRAACVGQDPAKWELSDRGLRGADYRKAHAICAQCPVRADCYDMAIRTRSTGHIFGGVDFTRAGIPSTRQVRPERRCPTCNEQFTPDSHHQLYCTPPCRWRAERDRAANRG